MEKNISKKIFENAQKFGSTISKFSDWTNPTPSTDVTFPRASLLISPYRSYFYSVSSNVFRQRSFPGERKKRYGTADKMERERESRPRETTSWQRFARDFGWNRAKDYPSLASFLPREELHNRNERSGPPSPFFQSFFNPSSLSQRSIFSDRSIFAGDK